MLARVLGTKCWPLFHLSAVFIITTFALIFIFSHSLCISMDILGAGWPPISQVHHAFQVVGVETNNTLSWMLFSQLSFKTFLSISTCNNLE